MQIVGSVGVPVNEEIGIASGPLLLCLPLCLSMAASTVAGSSTLRYRNVSAHRNEPAHPSERVAGQRRPQRQRRLAHCRALPRVTLYDAYDQQIPYEQAWRWQKETVEAVAAASAAARDAASADGEAPASDSAAGAPLGSLVLLQHPPVYTLGAGATEGHLKFDPAAAPLPMYRTERGGEVRCRRCCCWRGPHPSLRWLPLACSLGDTSTSQQAAAPSPAVPPRSATWPRPDLPASNRPCCPHQRR